jgi:hypothetical protein
MKRVGVLLVVAACLALTAPARAQSNSFPIQPSQVSGVTAVTTTRNQVRIPDGSYTADILINITAGGTATGTLQLWIEDSADGGTTWDDLVSSLTFALGAAPITQRFFVVAEGGVPSIVTTATATVITQGSAAATETLAAGSARQGPFGPLWRVREKITAPSGSPVGATYTITAALR